MQATPTAAQVIDPDLLLSLRLGLVRPGSNQVRNRSNSVTHVDTPKKMRSIYSALVNLGVVIQCMARIALYLSISIDAFS